MLRAVVTDDNENIRKKHIAIIKSSYPNIAITGQADSVESDLKIWYRIPRCGMPDGTGFELLQKLKPINFMVIFIIGYRLSFVYP